MEPHARAFLREHAVEHERVDVDVEIHGPAEPLDDRHGAATTIDHTGLSGRVP